MRTIETPGIPELFDKFAGALHPRLIAKLESGWEGLMRRVLLCLLPAWELGKDMSERWGRPSKEMFSSVHSHSSLLAEKRPTCISYTNWSLIVLVISVTSYVRGMISKPR